MATVLTTSVPWHDGESKMHRLLRVPNQDNPTVPFLNHGAGLLIRRSPLLAIGALDNEGKPWCSLWGGEEGLATPTSVSSFDIKTPVGRTYDPVVESLLLDPAGSNGKPVAFLAVNLESRRRVKLFGKITAGSLNVTGEDERIRAGIAHLTVHVNGSLGNCPKYLNAKRIVPAPPDPKLISETPQLHPQAMELLSHADCLFISSSHRAQDMDTNIRGGPAGFVRVLSNEPAGAVFAYPEYSGNRLYQTLGNLQITPLAGYVFPDFETGNALFVTGRTEILIGKEASSILPRSNLVVRVSVTSARFVGKALSFRGVPGKSSPYNPTVRYLATEKNSAAALGNYESSVTATMIEKHIITPSIARFRFRISDPTEAGTWTPGQYATFSFFDELDMGYSHMMDDDPSSLNDDYVRTFTISSSPGHVPIGEFEITIRKHGNVTRYLFQTSDRAGLEVPLKGFGGEFRLPEPSSGILPFIAGGIGITPILAQIPVIDVSLLRLFWSISIKDIALVLDTFKRFPKLPPVTTVFISGLDTQSDETSPELEVAASSGAQIRGRRVEAQDLDLSLANVCRKTRHSAAASRWSYPGPGPSLTPLHKPRPISGLTLQGNFSILTIRYPLTSDISLFYRLVQHNQEDNSSSPLTTMSTYEGKKQSPSPLTKKHQLTHQLFQQLNTTLPPIPQPLNPKPKRAAAVPTSLPSSRLSPKSPRMKPARAAMLCPSPATSAPHSTLSPKR
ncbi:putative oxidoreductase, FAD-binding [Aspergillus mulundensis]|uniref:FAD-binding FR-type domain-containing protein n=1 Tax=Aspergillus mulundensis TaxID=1810919 RepID=A0A3D8S4X2_9EURO|nr:Uncharacterized protein DSM5745_04718 [Aspergillus mulundensis]RDW81161.1 Uncharacterized protein DSM5745_04718 [Aspergillus mulundensis]